MALSRQPSMAIRTSSTAIAGRSEQWDDAGTVKA